MVELTEAIRNLYATFRNIRRDNPEAELLALFDNYQVEIPENEIIHKYFIGDRLFITGIDLILRNFFHLEYTRQEYPLLLPEIFETLSIPNSDYISCDDEDYMQVCDYSINFEQSK